MPRRPWFMLLVAASLAVPGALQAATKRPLRAEDFDRLQTVESPSCSADGQWIAYTVTTTDREADELKSAVWIVNWAGTQNWRLTAPGDTASAPRFSPDGRYVSFLATRGTDEKSQLYVLDRRGGEARLLARAPGDITDYAWSPDGARIVIEVKGGADDGTATKKARPIVIDGFHFKEDRVGYVESTEHAHLALVDVATGRLEQLTTGDRYSERHPAWSPDGKRVAFISNHDEDPDRSGAEELYAMPAAQGGVATRLARFYSPNKQSVAYTADGRSIAVMIGLEPRLTAYIHDRLALVDAQGGEPAVVTDALDRAVSAPVPTGRAGALGVLVEDDRSQYPAIVDLARRRVDRTASGAMSATDECGAAGHVVVVASTDNEAPELRAVDGGALRALTHHNDALLEELALGKVEDISFKSRDGTEVHGLLTKPLGYVAGHRYPTVLWIHGGPNGQDQHGLAFDTYPLELERQWYAAHGYVALAINYRGSSGRGAAFQRAILGDWGHLEVEDLLAGVDYAVNAGIADPDHLAVGGWSYGGILTDYLIASDGRFKAAISGAGSANQLSMFGVDQYVLQYLSELGAPWVTPDRWLKVSYPFFHADRIHTPTLYMGGDKDFNVPIVGGEQMYQALRASGVPTRLVVYPGEYHLFTRPSHIRDRIERYADWYARYLK